MPHRVRRQGGRLCLLVLLIVLAIGLMAAPLASGAQEAGKPPRIGWLTSSVVHTPNLEAFRDGMRALGHPDIALEVGAAAGQMHRLPSLAAELVRRRVQVIVTDGGPAAVAAREATATIPIVIGATAGDLVKARLVSSLARPGGNVTGFTISTGPELYGKRMELLREALPNLNRMAILWNPGNEGSRASLNIIETAARRLGLQVGMVEARGAEGIDRAFASAVRSRAGAILTVADAFLWSQRASIVAASDRHKLPGMYPEVEFVQTGGLMAYGPNVVDNFRRAAGYVDKILKGANPADLPVQQPTKFEFVVNLGAAKTLGLTIPPTLLLQADRVVQ
jgi:putative tryptophan/tyrosine transport system substrate-binding protein